MCKKQPIVSCLLTLTQVRQASHERLHSLLSACFNRTQTLPKCTLHYRPVCSHVFSKNKLRVHDEFLCASSQPYFTSLQTHACTNSLGLYINASIKTLLFLALTSILASILVIHTYSSCVTIHGCISNYQLPKILECSLVRVIVIINWKRLASYLYNLSFLVIFLQSFSTY